MAGKGKNLYVGFGAGEESGLRSVVTWPEDHRFVIVH